MTERKAKGTKLGGKGTTQQARAPRVFFQKQKMGTRCRMHALNNALGRAAIGIEGFNAACDAFDARYGLSGSRLYFLLADVSPRPPPLAPGTLPLADHTRATHPVLPSPSVADEGDGAEPERPKNESDEAENEDGEHEVGREKGALEEGRQTTDDEEGREQEEEEEEDGDHDQESAIDDVLSFILRERFKYRTKYIPMGGTVNRLHREELNQCEAFLSFSAGHVWANRRVGNTWYCLDSLQGRPTPIKPNKALAAGLGHILIYAKSDQGGPEQTTATAEAENNRSPKKKKAMTKAMKKKAKEDRGERAPGEEHRKGVDVVQQVDHKTRDDDAEEESEEEEQEADLLAPTINPFDCLSGDE